MKFKLEFNMDNAAFQDGNREFEIGRLLDQIKEKVNQGSEGLIYDLNGNRVGSWGIIPENEQIKMKF